MRKKVVVVFLLFVAFCKSVSAQYQPSVVHYTMVSSYYNPATVVESNMVKVGGVHRLLNVGIAGAGASTFFGVDVPLKVLNEEFGIGVKFLSDKSGGFVSQKLFFQGAYKYKVDELTLSVGANVGFNSFGFESDSVSIGSVTLGEYYDYSFDNVIPKSDENGMALNLGLGVSLSSQAWTVGCSYLDFNQPRIRWSQSEIVQKGVLSFSGSYDFKLSNLRYEVTPTFLVMTNFDYSMFNYGARVEYESKYRIGFGLRNFDVASFLVGLHTSRGVDLGYAYELPLNKLVVGAFGTHELYLSYDFEPILRKNKKKYKSVRFL